MKRAWSCCVLFACLLAGCETQPIDAPPTGEMPPVPPAEMPVADIPADDMPADEMPPATVGCDPAPVQVLFGQVASAELSARAREAAGARSVRTLAPGEATTREYAEGRLNLQLDAEQRIVRASCG